MLPAIGLLSSGVDALQSLFSSQSASNQSSSQTINNPFDPTAGNSSQTTSAQPPIGSSAYQQISPQTMSALIAAQSQSGTSASTSSSTSFKDPLQDLFSLIDGNGDGQISKSEFESALGAGGTNTAQADKVFGELDKNGDGSVSLDEMKSALQGAGGHHGGHHHHAAASGDSDGSGTSGGSSGANSDPLMQALAGSSSTSTTNSDGSTTTTLTFADGSKVTMTSPAASPASASATSSYNLIEQLIKREAQAVSANSTSTVALSA